MENHVARGVGSTSFMATFIHLGGVQVGTVTGRSAGVSSGFIAENGVPNPGFQNRTR
jgi:hypothetical protein